MKKITFKSQLALTASVVMLAGFTSTSAHAQTTDTSISEEDVIVTTGTRRSQRSAADTVAPVDVIGAVEFTQSASTDLQDLLRTSIPSFNVNRQSISDASTISRPANLRGLSPDNTLVLVNGKRRHRGAVITFLGGGISDGSQGVDLESIPSAALKQVEVLRDGASSQYGSDAIAGVINFQLNDATEGGTVEVQYGSTYEGDGDNFRVSGNTGFGLGEKGFVNVTAEYGNVDGTSRSFIRPDVAALIAAGNTAVSDFETINTYTDEVPQYWGQPDVKDNLKLFINSGVELSDNAELYAFGGYSERRVEGGFFFRNPTNRGGVYGGPSVDAVTGALDPNGVSSILVGDLDGVGVGGTCPAGIPLTGTDGLIADPTVLAAVTADPNCFSFVETIPGGFVPRFGGDNQDFSVVGGLRGELDIATNNMHVALILSQNPSFQIMIGGGQIRNHDGGIVGHETTQFMNDYRLDLGIIGISGIDEEGTLLDYDLNEVRTSKIIIQNSKHVILVTDSSKFGKRALYKVGALSDIDELVTDINFPEKYRNLIQKAGVNLIEVST